MLFTEDEWPGGKNLAISPAIWRELFKRLPSDMLGLNFDPSHFIWQEMDYIKPLYEFKDKIFHVHYKDIKVNKDARNDVGILATPLSYMLPCIPGHGDVDWSEYIRVLLETGYKGAACIEIEDKSFENDKESIENSLKISRQYLKQFINFPEKGKSMKKIRVGVIGLGFIGKQHVEALRRLPYIEIVAGSDSNLSMREWCEKMEFKNIIQIIKKC